VVVAQAVAAIAMAVDNNKVLVPIVRMIPPAWSFLVGNPT
jgi:hypothetical protein